MFSLESLSDGQLVFDHSLCHAMFNRKRDTPEAVAWSLENIADYHHLLQAEITRRGFVHKCFDELDGIAVGKATTEAIRNMVQQINASSLYLHPPHAEKIWKGEQTLIAKSRNYCGMLNKPLYFGDNNYIYGILKFTEVIPVSKAEFSKFESQHHVDKAERERCWADCDRLYLYKFDIICKFDTPLDHVYQRGVQVFFPSPEWKKLSEPTIAVSLDNVIAKVDVNSRIPDAYLNASVAFDDVREKLRALMDKGKVIIYTDRDSRYCEVTAKWLEKNGIPYNAFILGKPPADYYIEKLSDIEGDMGFFPGRTWEGVQTHGSGNVSSYTSQSKEQTRTVIGRDKETPKAELFPPRTENKMEKTNGYTVATQGEVGVQNMGGGERIPDPSDNSFKEVTPLQYVHTDGQKIHAHFFFNGKDAKKSAMRFYNRIKHTLGQLGKVNLDSDGENASVSLDAPNCEAIHDGVKKSVNDVTKTYIRCHNCNWDNGDFTLNEDGTPKAWLHLEDTRSRKVAEKLIKEQLYHNMKEFKEKNRDAICPKCGKNMLGC